MEELNEEEMKEMAGGACVGGKYVNNKFNVIRADSLYGVLIRICDINYTSFCDIKVKYGPKIKIARGKKVEKAGLIIDWSNDKMLKITRKQKTTDPTNHIEFEVDFYSYSAKNGDNHDCKSFRI